MPVQTYPHPTLPAAVKITLSFCGLASIAGAAGFLYTALTRESAGFLALSLGSALGGLGVLWRTLSSQGLATILPAKLHPALFEWTPVEIAVAINSAMDVEAAKRLAKELAPLLLCRTREEFAEACEHMGTQWRTTLQTKGLVSFLPWETQKVLLPPAVARQREPLQLAKAQTELLDKPADLDAQVEFFQKLAAARAAETTRALEEHSRFVRSLTYLVKQARWGRAKLRASSWAEIQVFAIAAFFVLLFSRSLARALLALLRFLLSELLALLGA
jgi:hypothetical protein